MVEAIIDFCRENGVYGLMLLAFADSFVSPIMPDIIMVPLCLAEPDKAIFYSFLATISSVAGGFIGYSLGARLGPVCIVRFIPPHHWETIRNLVEKHGAWAVFWGAIMPIPYKFVSISAGVLGLNRNLFLIVTIIGRSKRFLLEGILLYYFGVPLAKTWEQYNEYGIWIVGGVIIATILGYKLFRVPKSQQ
ncbi:MAG TPA: VTT domain-containing protein [Methylomusa anaerophila]|uniref:SNARE associated Golgi protein n=1 Tax=Methylomusa anaerophila TaxID=1930071 RepID=A0A348ALY9_9FIRM|nr:VTT domain-containing protein [Methylomusa anaerophila]BBB92087.1 SNARE associated Golgi protein [Methylomusa anaerophila]HML87899.1 VTT domain-containing protein [Methylomusa anaerophila]